MLKKAAALAALFVILSFATCAWAYSAKAYAVIDGASGRVVDGSNMTARLPMASTTKIMTGLLACESGKLDKTVTVPEEALHIEGTSMGLVAGEHLTLRELVYGLLLRSGNDAANTIALYLGGSIDGFAAMMNKRAQELRLTDTHFVTPSGLDASGHYTSALDLARLGSYAMKNKEFAKIAGTKSIRVSYDGMKNGRQLNNHNRLLGTCEGVTGVKTGFTKKDGRCLVTSCTRGGITFVIATLNDPNDWKDHSDIYDTVFSRYHSSPLLMSAPDLSQQVVGGLAEKVKLSCNLPVTAALTDAEAGNVSMHLELPRFSYAPVRKGQQLGEMVYTIGGTVVARAPLLAAEEVSVQRPRAAAKNGGFFIRFGLWLLAALLLLLFAGSVLRRRKNRREDA